MHLNKTRFYLLLIFSFFIFEQKQAAAQTKPNILLVISDDLGVDYTNGYHQGALMPTTPIIDSLRTVGVTFDNAFATPKCATSRAAILSGKYGIINGVTSVPGVLDTVHTSVFKELATQTNNAYADAVVGKWHVGGNNLNHPTEHGADFYSGSIGNLADYYDWEKTENGASSQSTTYATTDFTDTSIDWIENQTKPWFLWLAHCAPHGPVHVPPADLFTINGTNANNRKYVAMIEAMDHEMGRLFASMSVAERDNTIVIYVGDNGTPNQYLQDYPRQHGKNSMYQGGIRVPMIVGGGPVSRKGEREAALVHFVDIYSTILELAGANLPGGIHNSLSFKDLLDGSPQATRDYNYSEIDGETRNGYTIRGEQYKVIKFTDGAEEMYDLVNDSLEVNDLLLGNLTPVQETIKADLEAEALVIRMGSSCRDYIQNGNETDIDEGGNCADANPCDSIINLENDPSINGWLQNTTIMGRYYLRGNSTPIPQNILANVQKVEYSDDWVYITTNGIPTYPTGPYLDRRTDNVTAESQNGIFRFPLNPQENTGAPDNTTGGNIGLFVNGVALFDYRDGVGWNSMTNTLCGGPGNDPCPGGPRNPTAWMRDAVPAEMTGFDCSKGHPANGNYHHHQNPSAFDLDQNVLVDICNLYDSEGLYVIDSTKHSPLIGFAYDGFPIYGAYGYKNADGTGGIARIKTSYELRNITQRTHHSDGTDVDDGPDVDATYFLGYFREDYEFINHLEEDFLDEHNGRFCITPEYPNGTYAYFATVDENWNSAYPYVVGPDFYGPNIAGRVTSITEQVTTFVEIDGDNDGFFSYEDCDDNNPEINPDATEIPNNGIDEDCDCEDAVSAIDADMDGFNSDEDCDDSNASINPAATEIPNNDIDEDCDGVALIIDADMDGFNSDEDCDDSNASINPAATEIPNNDIDEDCDGVALIIDVDMDGFNSDEDCDDSNASINPAATEIPNNNIDEDCDGVALIIDVDMDGFNSDEDCDDSNASINPAATEIPNNNIDEDCDGVALIIDVDMDGFNSDEDCDDSNADINPGATEIPNNDIDEDCDGVALIIDVDMDGFNSDEDCDDSNAEINPGATEIPNNGIDEDCNGFDSIVDEDMDGFNSNEDCDDNNALINPNAVEIPNNDVDEDCDGVALIIDVDMDGFNSDEDCDDTNVSINPDAVEIPNNDIDEDCDGVALIIDVDMDGFNSDEDCDDTNASINPDAVEVPNNDIDEDCDGIAQIIDNDMDGFNSDEDCDDENAAINPDAVEVPNNDIDEDCDGIAQIIDNDMDGFNSDEDCDDTNASINPDAVEIPDNGIDEDCDGMDATSGVNQIVGRTIKVFPNPSSEFVVIQINGLNTKTLAVTVFDMTGKKMAEKEIFQGSTMCHIDVRTFYPGEYVAYISNGIEKGVVKFLVAGE